MQSCLDTNQVWEVCNGHHPEPHKPNPRRDMIKETFLLLPDKTEEDWKQYDVINKEYKIWAEANRRATILIKRYINDTIQSELGRYSNAKTIWDYLDRTYKQSIVAPAHQLLQSIHSARLSDNSTVTEYLEKINRQAFELEQLGWKLPDPIIASFMLFGLTDRYDSLVSEIQNTPLSEWKSEWVKNRVLTYKIPESKPSASANFTRGQKRKRGIKDDLNKEKKEDQQSTCKHCKKKGHEDENCWFKYPHKRPRRHGQFFGSKEKVNNTTTASVKPESAMHTRLSGKIIEREDPHAFETDWYIDSAATRHFCKDARVFETLGPCNIPIEVANGEIVKSSGVGTLILPLKTQGGDVEDINFPNVICAPELNVNLLSVDQLNEEGYGVTLLPEGSEIFDLQTRKHVAEIIRVNKLYKVIFQKHGEKAHVYKTKTPKEWPLSLWHRRLGHLGKRDLMKLLKAHKIRFSMDDLKGEEACECCQKARQTRLPFNRNARRTKRPFELVHTDICGPFPQSYDGFKYFVTFTDDFSRFTCIFPMKNKSDLKDIFKRYSRRMKRQFGWRIKRLRSDNGGEYASNALDEFLSEEGIIWEATVGYTPPENGVSERLNRTLCEKLRALLFESGLPIELWSNLVETATYLKNRSPTRALKGKTPYEFLYKRRPDLSNIKIIGCKSWVAIPKEKLQKLDSRSVECRLIGYAASTQYILYQVDIEKVIYSRDVIFDEGFGPRGDENEDFLNTEQVDFEVFRTDQELQFLASNPNPESSDKNHSRESSHEASPSEIPVLGDFDAPNPDQDDESNSSESESEIHNVLKSMREPSFSRFGRKRIPSQRLQEAETAWLAVGADEPTYAEAMSSADRSKWNEAINDEYNSLLENQTWTLVKKEEIPETHKPIDGKWFLKIKHDGRYKARWVIRGFKQEFGVDYTEIFAPVARMSSYRTLFALAAINHLTVFHLDVKTAFLYGDLDEEIYMTQPIGFETPGYVCKLRKSIYGLKQAPRVWAQRLRKTLISSGFHRLESDHCIYIKSTQNFPIIVGIYVDDILLAAKGYQEAKEVSEILAKEYKMTDLGPVKRFLGVDIIQNPAQGSIFLHQESYLNKVLERFGMDRCAPKMMPLPTGIDLDLENAGPLLENDDKARYHSAVGAIMFAATHTRPDLAYAASLLSRFVAKPQKAHNQALQHVFRYIRGHTKYGITYSDVSRKLYGYTDSDHGGTVHKEGRRSTSGYIFWLANGPISWSSKRQTTVATSTAEAEYIGQFNAGTESVWIRKFLTELGFKHLASDATVIHGDNETAIKLAKDPIQHSKAKHIQIKYHWQRERVEEGDFCFEYTPSNKNLADWMTKPMTGDRFNIILNQIMTEVGNQQDSHRIQPEGVC